MPFGARDLSQGMSGTDVQTLNWVLRGLALGTPYDGYFLDTTAAAVRSFQTSAALPVDGVVGQTTRKALASRMLNQVASWYGPTFYGNRTACGQRLTQGDRRRRPQEAPLRDQGGARLPGPLGADQGDRPRSLHHRKEVGPDPAACGATGDDSGGNCKSEGRRRPVTRPASQPSSC